MKENLWGIWWLGWGKCECVLLIDRLAIFDSLIAAFSPWAGVLCGVRVRWSWRHCCQHPGRWAPCTHVCMPCVCVLVGQECWGLGGRSHACSLVLTWPSMTEWKRVGCGGARECKLRSCSSSYWLDYLDEPKFDSLVLRCSFTTWQVCDLSEPVSSSPKWDHSFFLMESLRRFNE